MENYLINYFENVVLKKKLIHEKQKEKDKFSSSKFNFLDYIYFGENNISDFFNDILDVNGHHGQSDLFLNLFLSTVFKDNFSILDKIKKFRNIQPCVFREVRTLRNENQNRRIDIIIEWNQEFAIGIENKPFDKDQPNQLSDYSDHMKSFYKDFCLVYLSENEISEYSIKKSKLKNLVDGNKYRHISYSKEINMWLKECIQECKSEKFKYFLEDIKLKLKNHFIGMEVETKDEIVDFTISTNENIKAIFDIYHSYQNVLNKVASIFTNKLIEKFNKDEFNFKNETTDSTINIHITKNSWQKGISCSLATEYHDNVFLGIWQDTNFLENGFINDILARLQTTLAGKPESNWIWWSYPSKEYCNWKQSSDKVSLYNSNNSVDYFFHELSILISTVDEFHEKNSK